MTQARLGRKLVDQPQRGTRTLQLALIISLMVVRDLQADAGNPRLLAAGRSRAEGLGSERLARH
jgi:hypothetical protein